MITIGVDAREILGDTTGVGRYLSELLTRWTSRPDASARRFILFAPGDITLPLSRDHVETAGPAGGARRHLVGADHAPAGGWTRAARSCSSRRPTPRRSDCTIPLALTIHDVSFLAHPEWFRPRERLRRRWLTRQSARSAAVVLTDSVFSRDEIVKHTGLDAARVRIIPPGLSARHAGPGAPPPRRERLVLFVGTLLNRRRVPQLIDAFAVAAADLPDARLVIVGADRTWPAQDLGALAARLGVASKVEVRSYVGDAELASLYARASVFVFLSEYEGFGLTPLEALAAGVPIVVLDTPVAREVYGPAATYVPAADFGDRHRLDHSQPAHRQERRTRTDGGRTRGARAVFLGRGREPDARRDRDGLGTAMTAPRLSIVIVSFNTRADLERCLASLFAAPPSVPHDIVVVDNASRDGSAAAVRARWPSVQVIEQERNTGFSAANNVGIRSTHGRAAPAAEQ